MAVAHRGAISFGLVHIPVSLYTATQDSDIHFNQLHKETKERIRYKKTCPHCGEEVKPEDIVKGYEYDKDHYVIMTDEDFEKIKTEKDRTIQILHFTDIGNIEPIYYDKTYNVAPDAGGEKAFELLRRAMKDENKVAVAKTVMGTKEALLVIMPSESGILLETMFYKDEMKEMPKTYTKPEVNPEELKMAKMLINSMVKPFEPELYHDEYQERLRQVLEQKISGQEVVAAKDEPEAGNVINLMDALKASIEQSQGEKTPPKAKKASKKEKGA
ncbi:Ku protein [Caproiciproducens galactitolivorans]|uniref:Non-homologous end joining protein Ku n=1 Tax=Caproiciproducens galactitolivorans TaxID=642589 RepID=A0ABT4BS78_9FIRM|nr:Ku protein [Caproiciproducens galactitolivorans]MCY1713750.1 Ku protein [Caproiciproducens galactitolivorans]